MQKGKFITLEGGEGAGKSTQAVKLVEHLATRGIKAIATREVGGTEGAEALRDLWLSKPHAYWDPLTEVMLIMAARREHLCKVIWPALEKGTWVISDRYVDSTRAYQGIAQGLGVSKIDALYREIAGDFWPDSTLVLDLPVETGLARMRSRNGKSDRFEEQEIAFHQTLRHAFLGFSEQEPNRLTVIDAAHDAQTVAISTRAAIDAMIETIVDRIA